MGGGLGAWTSAITPNFNRDKLICMWQHRFGHLGPAHTLESPFKAAPW